MKFEIEEFKKILNIVEELLVLINNKTPNITEFLTLYGFVNLVYNCYDNHKEEFDLELTYTTKSVYIESVKTLTRYKFFN